MARPEAAPALFRLLSDSALSRAALGRPLAALLFRGDDALVHRLLAESVSRWELKAWAKDRTAKQVELALGAVRSAELAALKTLASAP